MMMSPLQQGIQVVIMFLQEGPARLQHAADVVHLHGQNLIHVLLFHALLAEQIHHTVALLHGNHIHQ